MEKEYKFGIPFKLPQCPKCNGEVTEVWKIVDFSMDDHIQYLCPLCLHRWRTK